ncbi:unnamed protein product, partial [Polarella glacialis]
FGSSDQSSATPIVFGFGAPSSASTQPASGTAAAPTFGFGAASSGTAIGSFGSGGSSAVSFGFGTSGSTPAPPAGGFTFGFGSGSAAAASAAPVTFGFGEGGFRPTVPSAPAALEEKALAQLPDFVRQGQVPIGDIFVHGSGECDQLGLGDDQRERQKPTLMKSLVGKQICDIAVGSMHVLCVSVGGGLYSWGCNDDGALGRPSSDGADGGPSDVEPHRVAMPGGAVVRKVSCGDCHSCALDDRGMVWLWGAYKDSNGHIGIARKRKHDEPWLEKSSEPGLVLEGCLHIASGTNHTVALTTASAGGKVFAWGSNGTGQLGLHSGLGCGFEERVVPASSTSLEGGLKVCARGGSEVAGQQVVRIQEASGTERSAAVMTPEQIRQALAAGAVGLVVEVPERDVPKAERRDLLHPQEMSLQEAGIAAGEVTGIFASAECSFVTLAGGAVKGCGLNGDGQVGLGFASMVVRTLKPLKGVDGASWLGGALHSTAALVQGRVFTWGKAEECGLGLGPEAALVMEPREVQGLPKVRAMRCGGHHMLASTQAGDAFVWGCGLTHQLANRPRNFADPSDKDEDPDDELRPYRVSSKQLESRFVLMADGGAQHSVELAWAGGYDELGSGDVEVRQEGHEPEQNKSTADLTAQKEEQAEPPAKRRATTEVEEPVLAESGAMSEPMFFSVPGFGAIDDGKWKCNTCSLRWEASLIKCGACESYKPGMSEADVAALQAEEEQRKQADIAKFRSASSVKATGFSFGGSGEASSTGSTFSFGSSDQSSATPIVFGFGAPSSASTRPASGTAAAPTFGFGAASSGPATGSFGSGGSSAVSFGFGTSGSTPAPPAGGFTFGFGSGSAAAASAAPVTFGFGEGGFRPTVPSAPAALEEKALAQLPDFVRQRQVPIGDIFVHGSGECDQLGLGDDQRERQKPTLMKSLVGKQICDIAVGSMHVLCVSVGGGLYSWGCNDDGALGRPSSDGADGGPSDVEPHRVAMPGGAVVRKVSCGDCHSCALDDRGMVWLWGAYKDSNGHIGIARKRKQDEPWLEKSSEPGLVLEGCLHIASGTNHTVALTTASAGGKVFAWGSNGTGQLGLHSGLGCGFEERVVPASSTSLEGGLKVCARGGSEVAGQQVVRIQEASGTERSAAVMTPEQIRQALAAGAVGLVVEVPERDVPKAERRDLLHPQEMSLQEAGIAAGEVTGIFASAECSFVTLAGGAVKGCGLNGDGQVGLGFASMVVRTLKPLKGVDGASWLGGALHSTAALVQGRVFTWGKAEECGLGLGPEAALVMEPREVQGLPKVRAMRCGGHHMLASTQAGDAFVWGCGLTHQLANRPRNFADPSDKDEDPDDELRPYRVSSKQLESRFVLVADGGAQHS